MSRSLLVSFALLFGAGCSAPSGRTTTVTTGGTTGSTTGSTTAGTTGGTTAGTTGGTIAGTIGGTNGGSTTGGGDGGSNDPCVTDPMACYTVYAHGDHTLYKIDLKAKSLVTIGPFNAPMVTIAGQMQEDVITDLAVDPNNVIYVVSKTTLYTADANDGHVTTVGSLAACGSYAVAATFTPDGSFYIGDYKGAFCKVDPMNPSNIQKMTLSGNHALSGDLVAVGDGTMYGSATILDTSTGKPTSATAANNLLVKIDPSNGNVTEIGSIGSKNLFGLSYAAGQVFGFTHDCSGDVVVIDPKTGQGTPYNMFQDPSPNCQEKNNNGTGISFAGAGVNSMVAPIPIM